MSPTSKRGVYALAIVGISVLAGALCLIQTSRPHAPARYYDIDTREPLADDDPRLNFSHYLEAIKEKHDRELKEHPEKFAPPKFP
jgi:hypothetical protein